MMEDKTFDELWKMLREMIASLKVEKRNATLFSEQRILDKQLKDARRLVREGRRIIL